MAFLISLHPSLLHREYEVGADEVTVGRDAATCDIVVSGSTISRQHLKILCRNKAQFVLQDLNSTNGVFVNGQRVRGEAVLREGDRIGIGAAQPEYFRFEFESGRKKPWISDIAPKKTWVLGRDFANDVSFSFDSTVSSQHATAQPKGQQVEIRDLGSLNGTWVNGRRARKALLEPTDTVMIGSTMLRLQLQSDGTLRVVRRDCRDQIALESIALTRLVKPRGYGLFSRAGKKILRGVCLAVRPGEFVGFLGPSGAGKSTLLKALNGFEPPSYGCVLLNETPLYKSLGMFRNTIGYVPQDDIVHADLTVEDSLEYVARLRLPPDVTHEQRQELIDSTLETLGLSHVRASRIYELSGGQRKRVSIGCELITRPSILFLDEPTSGMDPSTEERLMRHFQAMARRGTTVLITTHILYNLALLDRVAILARGRLAFFGTPDEAMGFFTYQGRPIERPTQIFDALELDQPTEQATGSGDPKDRVAAAYERKYVESELFKRHIGGQFSDVAGELLAASARDGRPGDSTGRAPVPTQASGGRTVHYDSLLTRPAGRLRLPGLPRDFFSLRSFLTLTQRQFSIKLVSRRRALFYFTVPLVLALVTLSLRTPPIGEDAAMQDEKARLSNQIHGGPIDLGDPLKAILSPDGAGDPRPAEDVVFALKHEGVANLPAPLSVLLMFVMTAIFTGTLMACLDLSTERPIYLRERMANQRIADYLFSKLPFLLLVTALQCAVFLLLCRCKPGLREFSVPGAYLALVGMAWTSCAMGLFLSAVDPTAGQFSVILAIVAVLPQLVLSGGLGPDFYQGMPRAMKALADAFPARWGLEMLTTAFYRHPERISLKWVEEFVPATIGFQFGPGVYLSRSVVLLGEFMGWLALCGLALRRLDRVR